METSNYVHRCNFQSEAHLVETVLATRGMGLAFTLGERRQEERRQNGDDGDDEQQFRETEASRCRKPNWTPAAENFHAA